MYWMSAGRKPAAIRIRSNFASVPALEKMIAEMFSAPGRSKKPVSIEPVAKLRWRAELSDFAG
jgi:hypothetical protein